MPSSPGYIRNYKQEAASEDATRKHQRTMRVKARRAFAMALGHQIPQGMDVDHKKELGKGGSNRLGNLRLSQAAKNRSYPRNSDGSMK